MQPNVRYDRYMNNEITQQPTPQDDNKLTKRDYIKTAIFLTVAAVVIVLIVLWFKGPSDERANIEKNGIEATAISDGRVRVRDERITRRSSETRYKAWYSYEGKDGVERSVVGEKDYGKDNNIKPGMKATIRYLEDKPYDPVFITEE